jgi:hypothetical protein
MERMDNQDVGQAPSDPVVSETVPAAEPVGAGVGGSSWSSSSGSGGPDFDNVRNRMNSATAGIENSAAAASARGMLAPLEQFGRQPIAWAGAALTVIGLWTSVKTYSFSIVGISESVSINMWQMNGLWSLLILLLAAVSAFAAWQRDYRPLWITGGVIAVIELLNLVFTFRGVAGLSAHPTWGWIVLILGVLGILAAAVMRPNPNEPQGDVIGYIQRLTNGSR